MKTPKRRRRKFVPGQNEDEHRWTWQTIASFAVIVLLLAGSLFAVIGVATGWLESPPSPEGTYPPAAGQY